MLNYVIIIIFRKLDAITFCAFVLDSVSVIMFSVSVHYSSIFSFKKSR